MRNCKGNSDAGDEGAPDLPRAAQKETNIWGGDNRSEEEWRKWWFGAFKNIIFFLRIRFVSDLKPVAWKVIRPEQLSLGPDRFYPLLATMGPIAVKRTEGKQKTLCLWSRVQGPPGHRGMCLSLSGTVRKDGSCCLPAPNLLGLCVFVLTSLVPLWDKSDLKEQGDTSYR